jgi:2-dehydropantoate 2-reductase
VRGILDIGRYPAGTDEVAEQVAADLRIASFAARADPDIMRWKYRKLLTNLGTSLEAVCGDKGDTARRRQLLGRTEAEGVACLEAAAIEVATREEDEERRKAMPPRHTWRRVGGGTGSSWQSLARETGSIEADWLNGEIVLLGREHNVPTPVNAVLQILADRMAWERRKPGSVPLGDVEQAILRYETQVQNDRTSGDSPALSSAQRDSSCSAR